MEPQVNRPGPEHEDTITLEFYKVYAKGSDEQIKKLREVADRLAEALANYINPTMRETGSLASYEQGRAALAAYREATGRE